MLQLSHELSKTTDHLQVVGQVIISLLRLTTSSTSGIVDGLITPALTRIRTGTTSTTLLQILEESLKRSSIENLPPDTVSLLMQHICNRYACNCLSLVLSRLSDQTFANFIDSHMSQIPNNSVNKLMLAASQNGSLVRFIPFIDSHVIPQLSSSLSTEDPIDLTHAVACLQEFLVLRFKVSGRRVLSVSRIEPILPLIKRLVTFGIYIPTPRQTFVDDDFDYSDDEDNSWEIRRSVIRLISAVVASPDNSTPWNVFESRDDVSFTFRSEFEPVLTKQLSSGETDQAVLVELLTYFATNQVNDTNRSSLIEILKSRETIFGNNTKCRELCDGILGTNLTDLPPNGSRKPVVEFSPEVTDNLETLYSELVRFDTKITLITNQTIELLSQLVARISLDESCIKQIDLGAFKHKEDPKAADRKLAILCIDSMFRKFDNCEIEFRDSVDCQSVLALAIEAIINSISIDLNDSGEDLYPSTISLINTLTVLNASVVVSVIPALLNGLLKIVSSCPVGKREGVNHSGLVLGQLIQSVIGVMRLVASDNGLSLKTIVSRDYPLVVEIVQIVSKEKTEGSILLTAHQTIPRDVLEII
jgi:hypothetical protein